jgi:hypothetical protein
MKDARVLHTEHLAPAHGAYGSLLPCTTTLLLSRVTLTVSVCVHLAGFQQVMVHRADHEHWQSDDAACVR